MHVYIYISIYNLYFAQSLLIRGKGVKDYLAIIIWRSSDRLWETRRSAIKIQLAQTRMLYECYISHLFSDSSY